MNLPEPCRPSHRLNLADQGLLAVDRTLRRLGSAGFETQILLWLDRRLDPRALRAALDRLSHAFPNLTARLLLRDNLGRPAWCPGPGTSASLQQIDLLSTEAVAALDQAARLLSTSADPVATDPARFYLLHLPDGRDVLLMQFNHALMDFQRAVLLLQRLNRCLVFPEEEISTLPSNTDPVLHHLKRFSRPRRRAALQTITPWLRRLKGGAVQLAGGGQEGADGSRLHLHCRCLDADSTSRLEAELLKTHGLPNLAMGLLAAAFRAIGRLAGTGAKGRFFCAGLGVDLPLHRAHAQGLQNLTSFVPVIAAHEDLAIRTDLTRMLNRQLRELLAADMDLGILQLVSFFRRRPSDAEWAIELLLRYCLSLWFAYFGVLKLGPQFGAAKVETAFSVGPAWSPVGLTLLVNQFQGQLSFQVTSVPAAVPDSCVEAFLDLVFEDLTT